MDAPGADPKLELLRGVPLFAGLAPKELEAVAAITEERDVLDGVTLTHEGRHEGYFYLIGSGRVRIESEGRTLNTLGDGDFLGEISLLDGGPRTATAVTETECRLLVMTYRRFQELLDTSPEVRSAILATVGQRLRNLEADSGT
jgi:CRP/FNR family cyclic AMP-dependent transcriptional regulator